MTARSASMPDPLAQLCAAVDPPTMMRHLEEFARRIKLSGTPPELDNVRYLQATLDGYGYRTELILHDAYISLPGRARIELGAAKPDCITHSFSRASAPGGTRGEVVYAGAGTAKDFAGLDVRGKIALLEGIANPSASLNASEAGAIGQIHICPREHLHEMCISPVWGSPDPATVARLPRTVVLSLRNPDGAALRARLQAGETVQATLHAEVDTGWRRTPLLVAELLPPGSDADVPFVLFSGHQDTWYYGVMDNGGANATMLETARILAGERAAWRRGLRLCFWSGHSHGRYSGSAWYADTHWDELERRCAVHVNVDSTGATGNTVMTDVLSSAELTGLAAEVIRAQGDQEITGLRMSRAGDQSFWGIGVPSLFMGIGEQPAGSTDNVMGPALGGGGLRKGAGFGWWWHTPDDTLDKMDPDLLARDTRVYVHAIHRLLTDAVLPLDYGAAAGVLEAELSGLARTLGGRLDLLPLAGRVAALRQAAAGVRRPADGPAAEAADRALMAAARALVPLDYTTGDRFAHDPALQQSPYPVLDPVRQLAAAAAGSDEARFLTVAARRACNRLGFAVQQATAALHAAS